MVTLAYCSDPRQRDFQRVISQNAVSGARGDNNVYSVGGIVPGLLLPSDRWRMPGTLWGWPILLFGACVLLWTVRDFYVIGRGTLAPWDPPRTLVVIGLFRFMRNPMDVGVVSFVAGLSVLTGSPVPGAYASLLAVGFHLRVVFYEEPTLDRLFGPRWASYEEAVNRWWPKFPGR